MKGKQVLVIMALILCCTTMGACAGTSMGKEAPRMAKEQLKAKLGSPDLIIIDVRTASDWESSDLKIQGAVREDPKAVNAWVNQYPKDKTLVFYCS